MKGYLGRFKKELDEMTEKIEKIHLLQKSNKEKIVTEWLQNIKTLLHNG